MTAEKTTKTGYDNRLCRLQGFYPLSDARLFIWNLQRYQFIFPAADIKLGCSFNSVNTVAAFHSFDKMVFARVIGLIYEVDACLINGNRVKACQDTDVLHARVFCYRTAVAVYGKVAHDIDVGNFPLEMLGNCPCGICHSF